MVKLRKAVDGSYFMVIRRALVETLGWKEGDELALLSVGGVVPQQNDYLLRKVSKL